MECLHRVNFDIYVTEDYILTELGESCNERGLSPIDSEAKCKSLTSIFRNYYPEINYGYKINFSTRPVGCYALTTRTSAYFGIYFNEHLSGGRDSRTRSLCTHFKGITSW